MKYLDNSLMEEKLLTVSQEVSQVYKELRKKQSYLVFLTKEQNRAEIAFLAVWSQ